MDTSKIGPRSQEGKHGRRLVRWLLALLGIQIEVYTPCHLGAVVVFGRSMRGTAPTGAGLN